MKKIGLGMIVVLMTGCAAPGIEKQQARSAWVTVTCSGFSGWGSCIRQAQNACRHGYDVANQEENPVTQMRSMQYACK